MSERSSVVNANRGWRSTVVRRLSLRESCASRRAVSSVDVARPVRCFRGAKGDESKGDKTTRRGLAMLELVLVLPLLLFVMALIVNFAAVARSKVQGWAVARHAIWASRPPRVGMAQPANWQLPLKNKGVANSDPVAALDDPRINLPVVRGQIPNLVVHDQLLDPTLGARRGWSSQTRDFPLLASMGPYSFNPRPDDDLLTGAWQHRRMGLWSTRQRRIPVIYTLPQADAAMVNAYMQAALAILQAPFRADLYPLDQDPEFIYYAQRFPGVTSGPPDFYPQMPLWCGYSCRATCGMDHQGVQRAVDRTIDRIQGNSARRIPGVAKRMTQAFIGLYRAVQNRLKAQLNTDPPPSAAEVAAIQREIDELQAKIDVLTAFLGTL